MFWSFGLCFRGWFISDIVVLRMFEIVYPSLFMRKMALLNKRFKVFWGFEGNLVCYFISLGSRVSLFKCFKNIIRLLFDAWSL